MNTAQRSFSSHLGLGRQRSAEPAGSGQSGLTSVPRPGLSRRAFLHRAGWALAGTGLGTRWVAAAAVAGPAGLAEETLAFIRRCAREDGGYAPSPDPRYEGNSDTRLSDLAAVTYAVVLAKTMGWELPHPERTIQFIQRHQQADGSFANQAGRMDPRGDLAVLYNTVQGVVALRALGQAPKKDPAPVPDRFFVNGAFKKLPWYATSFFPLFYAALGRPFPKDCDQALRHLQLASQTEDGYLGDHVAATFHMAHYFRLVGEPTPKAQPMVERVLRSQKPDGGFDIKEPDWDVHACFDAVFILRQLGGDTEPVRRALEKATQWALRCRNADGGFGHFPGRPSDLDAVYFQFGTLIQTGAVPGVRNNLPDAHLLGWGHAMQPGKNYKAVGPAAASTPEPPYWVEGMKAAHASFKGKAGYVAQFGDSITYSMAFWTPIGWDEPDKYLTTEDGFPKRPKEKRWRDTLGGFRAKGPEHGNYSGWRVGDVLKAMDSVLERQQPEAALILVGTNDISGGAVPEGYREGLRKVVQKCLEAHCVPLLNTIPPRRGREEAVEAANRVIREVALESKVPLADFHAECVRRRPGQTWDNTLISQDGIHPSGGEVNVYTEENLKTCGYALRNWVNFLAVRELYFRVLEPRS